MQKIERQTLTAQLSGLFCVDMGLTQGGDLTSKPRRRAVARWDGLVFVGGREDVHTNRWRTSDAREGSRMGRGHKMLNLRQFSAVSVEELAAIASQLGIAEVRAEWLGANLLFSGIPHMTRLPHGTRFFFPSGAVLQSAGENVPCKHPGRVIQQKLPEAGLTETDFIRSALERRGIVGFTLREGVIRPGDEVVVEIPKHWAYSLQSL